jgi:predicted Zn-dependent peptidase
MMGAGIGDPAHRALRIVAALLDGQAGRLFLSLREARGLAYSIWADSWSGIDGGRFSVGVTTDRRRADDARGVVAAELERLLAAPPDDSEIERVRRMILGHQAMGMERASGRAADLAIGERLSLPWGLAAHRQAMAEIDADRVRAAVERLLAAPRVEVIVEPR